VSRQLTGAAGWAWALLAFLAFCSAGTAAQPATPQTSAVTGTVTNAATSAPIEGAIVLLDLPAEGREATTGADGTFTIPDVPAGPHHLIVTAPGYLAAHSDLTLTAGQAATLDVKLIVEPHYTEVVSVSPEARSQFETYQPTSVLSGQELDKQLEMSLGETLANQPGVTTRTFGPATSRPVVRGLDGDRVLILQDGQRTGDLSSQSADHAVTVNPAAAERIEVVRGPSTLLYGSNAIGGLVNVITDQIPTTPFEGTNGNVVFDAGSAAEESGAAGEVRVGNGTFAMTAGGGGRRSGDVQTPAGEVLNSQSRSGFGNVGLAWTGARGYFGGGYGYDDTRLGIPEVEGGILQSTPRKHSFTLRGGAQQLTGFFEAFRATATVRRYKHEELHGENVGTAFRNDTNELELIGHHAAFGRVKGSVGGWVLGRAFDAVGEEALSPAVDQTGFAAFLYEEIEWPHVTLELAGRVDHTRYDPRGEPERRFTTGSGSAGVLFRPLAADGAFTVALSLARTARYPALEELFYFGPHPGNFAFEIGNPDIGAEHALGLDVALRWRTARASGEITYFRNAIGDYLFRRPVSEEEFAAREAEFAARFPSRDIGGEAHEGEEEESGEEDADGHGHDEFPFAEYVAADSLLQGVELHGDVQVTPRWRAEVAVDFVRGTLEATGEPLPRIPPLRVRGGLRYQYNAFQAGGEVTAAARQDRVFGDETPTGGYELLRLFASYSFDAGGAVNTITARLDNATNELYRNHLSFIKHLVPEMGRNFRVLYTVRF
jgi:iron complex outermembrane receptor protein